MNKQTLDRVRSIVVDQLGIRDSALEPDSRFMEDCGADSLDMVELAMAIEEEFGFEISDEDAEKTKTYGQLLAYVEGRLTEHGK